MALQNPSALYTGGNERLNARPHVQLYAQLMQRKQAKDDALNEYYQKLHTSINPAGMRQKDILGGFSEKVDKWQADGVKYRDRIKNPKTIEDRQLAAGHMGMYQELLMDANRSKEAGMQEMKLAEQKISGKWNPTEDDIQVANAIGSSIYSDDYYKDPGVRTKPFSINDISLNVPNVTPKEQEEFYKAAVGNLKPGKTYDEKNLRRDNVSGQVFIPYQQSYQPDAVKKIGDNAGVLFPGNRTPIGIHYEKLLHDPNFFQDANEAYQSVYGENEIVDSPKKAAQAAAIMNTMADVSTGEEIKNDEALDFQKQKQLADYRHSLALQLKRTPGAAPDKGEDDSLYIQDWIRGASVKATRSEVPKDVLRGGGIPVKGGQYPMQLNTIIRKALNVQGVEPEEVLVRENEDGEFEYQPKYYENVPILNKNGTPELNDDGTAKTEKKLIPDLSNTRSEVDFLLDLGVKVPAKQRTKEAISAVKSNGQSAPQSNIPSYKKSDLINGGWTEQQIKQAVQAGKIKVN